MKKKWVIVSIIIASIMIVATVGTFWANNQSNTPNGDEFSLENNAVTPTEGVVDETTFVYSATCVVSGSVLTQSDVVIDGISHTMTSSDSVHFSYSTIFATNGQHTYYMNFSAGSANRRLPTAGIIMSPITVITPALIHSMFLTFANVTPDEGTTGITLFTYEVIYTDTENHAPSIKNVYIDNIPHAMIAEDEEDIDYTDGFAFYYQTTIATKGEHNYHFEFTCSETNTRLPTGTQMLSGPTVMKVVHIMSLTSYGVTPTTGIHGITVFTWYAVFTDSFNHTPTKANVVIQYSPTSKGTYAMMCNTDSNSVDGINFTFSMIFPGASPNYGYRFEFSCQDFNISVPSATGWIKNPKVT